MKKREKIITFVFFGFIIFMSLLPVIFIATNSLMSEIEIFNHYGLLYGQRNGVIEMTLSPDKISIKPYLELLFLTPEYFICLTNSVIVVVLIMFGQLVIASMAAYAFARLHFKGRDTLFFIYIVTMLLPFQAIFVPNYFTLNSLHMLDSLEALIYPGIFSTFGVFLLRQFMAYIPNACIEAAKIEGANQFEIFTRIIIPLSKNAIGALCILLFIDYWNMIEQPLLFIDDMTKWPLSIYLSEINKYQVNIAFPASTIYIIPTICVFLISRNALVEGIEYSSIKG